MKKKISLLMLVLLVLAWYVTLSSWLGNDEKYNNMVAEAQRLEAKGMYLAAIEQYEEAKEIKGNTLELEEYIADDYLAMGDYKEYRKKLRSIIERFGPVETDLVKLYDYTKEYSSENSVIDLVKEWYEKYPEDQKVKEYYDSIKGQYLERSCVYDEIGDFVGDYAVYSSNGKKGLIGEDGKIVIEAVYDELIYDGKNKEMIAVKDGDECFYMNDKGYKTDMPEEAYESLGIVSQNRIVAKKQGKYGYLDKSFQEKTEFVYESATPVYEGIGAVKRQDKWALINKKGELVTDFIYEDVAVNSRGICSLHKMVAVKQGESFFFIDEEGQRISDQSYEAVKAFETEGMCAVCVNGKWGYIDREENVKISYTYENAKSFSGGYAAVCEEGVWGYIDENGYMAVQPEFDDAGLMTETGTAPVRHGSTWTLVQLKILD
ncbi:MAG: WG repeat-containing protein [Eubacterium sp.]|nr:WG repeat-containing protein [Eubacterium sp.]